MIQVPFEDRAQAQGESQAILAAEIERVPPTRSLSGVLCVDLSDCAEGAAESGLGPREEDREVEGTGISDPVRAETEKPREVVREMDIPAAGETMSIQEAAADQDTVVRDPVQNILDVELTLTESAQIDRSVAQIIADVRLEDDLSDIGREITTTEVLSNGQNDEEEEVTTQLEVEAPAIDDFSRVIRWINWRTSPFTQLMTQAAVMEAEEQFALQWLGITEIPANQLLDLAHETREFKQNSGRADKGKGIAADETEGEPEEDPEIDAQFREDIRLATALSLGHNVQHMRGPGETSGVARDDENPIATAAIPLSQVNESALDEQVEASRGESETSEALEVAPNEVLLLPPPTSTPSNETDEAQTVREGEIPLLQLPGFPIDMELPSPFLLPEDTNSTFIARMIDRERWSAPVAPELIEISDSSEETEVLNEQQEQNYTSPAGSRSAEETDVIIEGGNREAPIDPSSPNSPADDQVPSTGSRGEADREVPLDGNREASNTEVPSLADPIQSVAEAEAPGSSGDEREVIHPSGGNREAPDMELPSSSEPSVPADPQRQVREVDSQMQVMGGNLEAPKSPPMQGTPNSPSSSDFGTQAEQVFIGEVRQFMTDQAQKMAQIERILAVVRNNAMPVAGTSSSQACHEELLEQTVWAEDAARKAADDAAIARSEVERTRNELAELRAEFRAYRNSSELRQDEVKAILDDLSNQVPAQLQALFEGVSTLLSRTDDANKGERTQGRTSTSKKRAASEPAGPPPKVPKTISKSAEEAKRAENLRIQRTLELEKRREEDKERRRKRQEQQSEEERKIDLLMTNFKFGSREDSEQSLTLQIFKLLKITGISAHSNMSPEECVAWWKDGVIEGEFVGEAYRNYRHLDVTDEYASLVDPKDPIKTREAINKKRAANKK